MQVVVLGMHRSGTTVATRLLHLLGCSFGGDCEFNPATDDNPRGYFERKDLWALSERTLAALGGSWFEVAGLDPAKLGAEERQAFEAEAREILGRLEPERPWVIKDPRLCLLFPLWRPLLADPVCVLVHRNPLEIARSLAQREGFPLLFGIALWESYQLAALAASQGLPRILVAHRQLLTDPGAATFQLFVGLRALGVNGFAEPSPASLASLVEPALYRARSKPGEEEEYLSPAQRRLAQAMASGEALAWQELPPVSPGGHDLLVRFAAERRTVAALYSERESLRRGDQAR